MNQKVKKIIAREFLFLLGSTIILIVSLFICVFLESRNDEKIDEIQNEIKSVSVELVSKIEAMEKSGESEEEIADMVQNSKQNKTLTELEKKLKKNENSFFNSIYYEQDIAAILIIIIFSITFGLRYLIYTTKWSIKQLKD